MRTLALVRLWMLLRCCSRHGLHLCAGQLDTICPYLSLAITAVSLIDVQQQSTISPSRLLVASAALRSAPQTPGASVYTIAQASALRPLCIREER